MHFQRSNGASLICLHEQNERNGDKYHYYVLYGLLAWTNDSTNIDHTVSPHLFTNIYNYRYWLEKRLKMHIWETVCSLRRWYIEHIRLFVAILALTNCEENVEKRTIEFASKNFVNKIVIIKRATICTKFLFLHCIFKFLWKKKISKAGQNSVIS